MFMDMQRSNELLMLFLEALFSGLLRTISECGNGTQCDGKLGHGRRLFLLCFVLFLLPTVVVVAVVICCHCRVQDQPESLSRKDRKGYL